MQFDKDIHGVGTLVHSIHKEFVGMIIESETSEYGDSTKIIYSILWDDGLVTEMIPDSDLKFMNVVKHLSKEEALVWKIKYAT